MPGERTIRDALQELRQLITVNKGAADDQLKYAEEGLARAKASSAAADAAAEVLDLITAQLGFSVSLEKVAASSAKGREPEPEPEEPEPGEEEPTPKKKKAAKAKVKAKKKAAPAAPEVVSETADPRFRFKLSDELNETDKNFFQLLQKNWPDFTSAGVFVDKGWIKNESVASPVITRMRAKGVPIESAKQARERGEDIEMTTSGWRLIIDE